MSWNFPTTTICYDTQNICGDFLGHGSWKVASLETYFSNLEVIQTKKAWNPENHTPQGTNISPEKSIIEDDFTFPQVGYVNSLEDNFPSSVRLHGFQ